ncbi:MAG: UDPGP type 1 family protein [Planctomycetota bacterium]|nr:MAG: UDPGP type 1 family protein [Planctomycetota bacterium]
MSIDAFALAEDLATQGQSHLLAGIDALPAEQRQTYLDRLAAVDWEELSHELPPPAAEEVGPSRVIDRAERQERQAALTEAGLAAYGAGQVAVLMVAGGMGSRLGFSGPKGCFEVGAHSGKSIYQIQAEKVLDAGRRHQCRIPFLVMTSPVTDAETREFFAANEYFGLEAEQLRFFSQGTVPSLSRSGQALLAGPGQLLENPDGHGGCFTALVGSGNLQRLRDEGIEYLVYIQVDNLLVPVDDPLLVGAAALEQAEVVTKVLAKAHPDEKVGHLVRVGEADRIIEYTELSPEDTRRRGADGELIYRWGSPAMHCWRVSFLSRLAEQGFRPPLHRSAKPLKAWVDGALNSVDGWKSERFIFDLIPEAKISIGLVIDRDDEFAPVKNAEGADSPDSARQLVSDCHRRWLEAAGVRVQLSEGQLIEISPRFAGSLASFQQRWDQRLQEVIGDYYLEGDQR